MWAYYISIINFRDTFIPEIKSSTLWFHDLYRSIRNERTRGPRRSPTSSAIKTLSTIILRHSSFWRTWNILVSRALMTLVGSICWNWSNVDATPKRRIIGNRHKRVWLRMMNSEIIEMGKASVSWKAITIRKSCQSVILGGTFWFLLSTPFFYGVKVVW